MLEIIAFAIAAMILILGASGFSFRKVVLAIITIGVVGAVILYAIQGIEAVGQHAMISLVATVQMTVVYGIGYALRHTLIRFGWITPKTTTAHDF